MVNWRNQFIYRPPGCPLTWNNHAAYIAKQQEAQLMASKKRPPLAWDGKKKLGFPIAIYYKGERFDNIVEYDVINGWFGYNHPGSAVPCGIARANFLVQRTA